MELAHFPVALWATPFALCPGLEDERVAFERRALPAAERAYLQDRSRANDS